MKKIRLPFRYEYMSPMRTHTNAVPMPVPALNSTKTSVPKLPPNAPKIIAVQNEASSPMQGTSGQFCLVNESTNPMIYVIIGGCAAGVLAAFIIIKVIKSGIKRRKKKAKLSDEEK